MVRRYWYLLRSSWPRLLDLVYWPAVQMLMWGFLQLYIAQNAGFFARAGGTFIGAVLLWDILFRGQLGFSLSFLEEMWSRNLANLLISPLRPVEFVLALTIMSVIHARHRRPSRWRCWRSPSSASTCSASGSRSRPFSSTCCSPAGRSASSCRGSSCATGSVPRTWPGPSCSSSCPSPASTIRSRFCRTGCSTSPGCCRRPTCSRACARCSSSTSSAPI